MKIKGTKEAKNLTHPLYFSPFISGRTNRATK